MKDNKRTGSTSMESQLEQKRALAMMKSAESDEMNAYWQYYQKGVSLSDVSEKEKNNSSAMEFAGMENDEDLLVRAKSRGLRDGLRWSTLTRSYTPAPFQLLEYESIVGSDLKVIRKRLGIQSQEEFADLVDTEKQNISNFERDRKKVQWGERVAVLLIDKLGQKAIDIIKAAKIGK